jgi:hypothetical protein
MIFIISLVQIDKPQGRILGRRRNSCPGRDQSPESKKPRAFGKAFAGHRDYVHVSENMENEQAISTLAAGARETRPDNFRLPVPPLRSRAP